MKQQRGFSLVEATMAGALVAGLAVAGMQMSGMAGKSQGKDQTVADAKAFTNLFRERLSYADSCLNTFAGKSASSSSSFDIKDDDGNVVFAANAKYESIIYLGLDITAPVAGDTTFIIPNDSGMIYVNAKFQRSGEAPGENIVKRKFKVAVMTDAAGIIQKCAAILPNADLWERTVNEPNDIMFLGGRVGIGKDPTVHLDVARNISLSTDDGKKLVLGGNTASQAHVVLMADQPLLFVQDSGPRADVTFGSLRATDGVAPGASTLSCNAGRVGALRMSGGNLQYCDGAVWRGTRNL